jgi:hypothetical protein
MLTRINFFVFNDNCTRGHIFQLFKPSVNKTLRKNSFPIRSQEPEILSKIKK